MKSSPSIPFKKRCWVLVKYTIFFIGISPRRTENVRVHFDAAFLRCVEFGIEAKVERGGVGFEHSFAARSGEFRGEGVGSGTTRFARWRMSAKAAARKTNRSGARKKKPGRSCAVPLPVHSRGVCLSLVSRKRESRAPNSFPTAERKGAIAVGIVGTDCRRFLRSAAFFPPLARNFPRTPPPTEFD